MFTFLEPLVEKGEPPREGRSTTEAQIWSELYCAVGPTEAYSPSKEYYGELLHCYQTASARGGAKLRLFLRPLIDEARRNIKAYSLPEEEFE